MGVKDIMSAITKNRDYEAEIAALKAELQAVKAEKETEKIRLEKDKKLLQGKVDVLEKSARILTDTDVAQKTSYELQKIMENFKQELAKLPPFKSKDAVNLQERYSYLSVLIDFFCVPVLEELGMAEMASRLKTMSKNFRSDGPEVIAGRILNATLSGRIRENPEHTLNEGLAKFIGCDDEKKTVLGEFAVNINNAQYTKAFVDYTIKKYGKNNLNELVPEDKDSMKKWLEMIIELGALARDFVASVGVPKDYASGGMHHILGMPEVYKNPFCHNDPERSGRTSNKIYEALLDLSKTYGIDLSKMMVYARGHNVCYPHYKPESLIQKEFSSGR